MGTHVGVCGFFYFQGSYCDQAAARGHQPQIQYARFLLLRGPYLKPRVEGT